MDVDLPIQASLYKLLLYEPGSFFKPHRDTEKEDGMFGTLVVQLPSDYSGGELVISHGKRSKQFDFSSGSNANNEFSTFFAAFFCDLEHEILPVTKGYRLCLIYNLVAIGRDVVPVAGVFDDAETKLIQVLQNWPTGKPSKLVYVLSHKYSRAGLSFKNLKNNDRSMAIKLKTMGNECFLSVYLAILSMCESGEGEDESTDSIMDAEYSYSLENWVCSEGKISFNNWNVDMDDEVIPSDCFDGRSPDKVENSGYMGNWGPTIDKWYRRAAIVFWPQDNTISILQKHGVSQSSIFQTFLERYKVVFSKPREDPTRQKFLGWAESLLNIGSGYDYEFINEVLKCQVLSAIIEIENLKLLQQFLDKFHQVTLSMIPLLVSQCEKYGWEILFPQLKRIFNEARKCTVAAEVLRTFVNDSKLVLNEKKNVVQRLVEELLQHNKYLQDNDDCFRILFQVCSKIEVDLSKHVLSKPNFVRKTVVPVLLDLAQEDAKMISGSYWICLAKQCIPHLESLAFENLPVADLRRKEILRCACADCRVLQSFLSGKERVVRLKMGKMRRLHLHQHMNSMKDISHVTERVGNPQTLVVTKLMTAAHRKKSDQDTAVTMLQKLRGLLNSSNPGSSSETPPAAKIPKMESTSETVESTSETSGFFK